MCFFLDFECRFGMNFRKIKFQQEKLCDSFEKLAMELMMAAQPLHLIFINIAHMAKTIVRRLITMPRLSSKCSPAPQVLGWPCVRAGPKE